MRRARATSRLFDLRPSHVALSKVGRACRASHVARPKPPFPRLREGRRCANDGDPGTAATGETPTPRGSGSLSLRPQKLSPFVFKHWQIPVSLKVSNASKKLLFHLGQRTFALKPKGYPFKGTGKVCDLKDS